MGSFINVLVDLPLPLSILLKSTLLLLIGWSLNGILRRQNPRWRQIVWRSCLTGLVLIPVLTPIGYLKVAIAPPSQTIRAADAYTPYDAVLSMDHPVEGSELSNATDPEVHVIARAPAASVNASVSFKVWIRKNGSSLLPAAWGLIVVVALGLTLCGWLRIRIMVSVAVPAPEPLQSLLNRVAQDFQVNATIQLRYSDRLGTPFLAGLAKPVIIIPERMLADGYRSQLPGVLAHEIAHIKSRDLFWLLLNRLIQMAYWFHPLVWKTRDAHGAACEEAGDAVAANYIGDSRSYSSTLAAIALEILGPVPALGGIPMARSAEVVSRIRILKQRLYPARLPRQWMALSLGLGVFMLALIGGFSLTQAEPAALTIPGRILHFPEDCSLGRLMIMDDSLKREVQTFHYWDNNVNWGDKASYLSHARGEVSVPAGKRVHLYVSEQAASDLSPLGQLQPDDLYALTLPASANDSCMDFVTQLTGLRELTLAGDISSQGLDHIARLILLERLNLSDKVGNTGLNRAVQLPALKGLYLVGNNTRITNQGLKALSKSETIEELSLGGERIGDEGLANITGLKTLRYLILSGTNFTDAGLAHLTAIPSLEIVNVMHQSIGDEGVRHLSRLPALKHLCLYNTQVSDQGLASLTALPNLQKLDIGKRDAGQTQITDAGMAHLARIPSLTYLDLPNGGITDQGLARIATLKNLRHLWVGGYTNSPLNDAALKHLSQLTQLEYLLIGGTGFSDAGLDALINLNKLKTLNLIAPAITNAGLVKINSLTELEDLSLTCKNASIAGISGLNRLGKLKRLKITEVRQDDTGLDLSGLHNLEELTLTLGLSRIDNVRIYDALSDEDLSTLKHLHNLRWFQVGLTQHSAITNAGFAHLKGLTNLTKLVIGSPYLTNECLDNLAGMDQLNFVRLTGSFTDGSLDRLSRLPALGYLNILTSRMIGQIARQSFLAAMPHLDAKALVIEENRVLPDQVSIHDLSGGKKPAPSFSLKTLDGKTIRLQDYRGKVVILYFWATWCGPCVANVPELKEMYADLKASYGDRFELIGLSMDNADFVVKKHVDSCQLPWPQVRIGRHSKMSSDYGVEDIAPSYFLIGPDGSLLLTPKSDQVDTRWYIQKLLAE